MAREARIDTAGTVRGVERTPQGGVRVLANVARVGVMRYRNDNGEEWNELVPPETAFAAESLATLRGAPVTDMHPSSMVTTATFGSVARGHTADGVSHDDTYVTAPLVVQDADLVAKIERGERREVSPGYAAEIDPTPGVYAPTGERYDRVQRSRVYNHVALGPDGWARGGPDVALRMDGAAVQVTAPSGAAVQVHRAYSAQGNAMKKTIKVKTRGAVKEFKCDSDDEMDAAQAAVDATASEGDAAAAKVGTLSAELEATKNALMAALQQVAAAEAKAKAQEVAAAGAGKAEVKEGDVPDAVADSIATKRLALRERAAKVLGADAKLDGKSAATIHREVVAKALPEVKLDGLSGETLAGMFEAVTAKAATTARADTALASAGNIAVGAQTAGIVDRTDAGEASLSLQQQLVERGQKPIFGVKGN